MTETSSITIRILALTLKIGFKTLMKNIYLIINDFGTDHELYDIQNKTFSLKLAPFIHLLKKRHQKSDTHIKIIYNLYTSKEQIKEVFKFCE